MKRTGEIVLTVIGIVINTIMAVGVLLIISAFQSEGFQQQMESQINNNPEMAANPNQIMDMVSNIGWAAVIATVIGLILGLIAVFSLKGNRKPKQAGILLIIAAIIVAVVSVGLGWLPALLYLIAGIMSLVRKPRVDTVS